MGGEVFVAGEGEVNIRVKNVIGAGRKRGQRKAVGVDDDARARPFLARSVITWVAAVNASDVVAERWGYMLASEQVISAASSWSALRSAAQVSG